MLDIIIPSLVMIYCLSMMYLLWRPSRENRSALFLNFATLFAFLWTFSILATVVDRDHTRVVFWSRSSFFFPIFIAFSFSRFNACFMPEEVKVKIYGSITKSIIALLMTAGAAFAFISFTPLIIADVQNLKSTFGPLQSTYSFLLLFAFLVIDIDLIRGYFLSPKKVRLQYSYVLLGVITSSIMGIITNLFIPMFTHMEIRYLGPLGVIFFLSFTTYALVKRQLYNINLFITEAFSLLMLASLVANLLYSRSGLEVALKTILLLLATYSSSRLVIDVRRELDQNKRIKKLNSELEKDKKQLQELDRMKDEFLQMATHELNTPITVIQGRLDMAIREDMCHLNDDQKKFLYPVYEDSMRLARMSKDLLNVTRIDQNRFKINPAPGNIVELVQKLVADMQIKAAERHNRIEIKEIDEIPELLFDANKISEVVTNFLTNANKFTENGEIDLYLKNEGNLVTVAVKDSGVGIAEDDQRHLFEKFYQAARFDPNKPQEQQGSGLGLYISKNIIEMHGGTIGVTSAKDQGSTFYFKLPVKTVNNSESSATVITRAD